MQMKLTGDAIIANTSSCVTVLASDNQIFTIDPRDDMQGILPLMRHYTVV